MSERFKVRVTKDHLVFCSGHFISYEGDKCERLHGHNYRTAVEVEGDLDENHYVFDFIALKHRTKAITDELDHRMMLPTRNPLIRVGGRAAQRPRPLPRPRMALPARRLRAAADREHDRGTAGPLHRRAAAGGAAASGTASRRTVLRVEVEESPASRRPTNGGSDPPGIRYPQCQSAVVQGRGDQNGRDTRCAQPIQILHPANSPAGADLDTGM